MKEGRKEDASILRLCMAAIIQKDKVTGTPATEDDVIKVLRKQVKQCREAAEAFAKGNRPEQAKIEVKQAQFLESYLPGEPTAEELEALLQGVIQKTGASSEREMGKVMGAAMKELKGRIDGSKVQAMVLAMLRRGVSS